MCYLILFVDPSLSLRHTCIEIGPPAPRMVPPSILPVTAVRFVSLGHGDDFVLAGAGPEVLAYPLGRATPRTRLNVLPSGIRVHRIVQCRAHDGRIIVHGGRFIALVKFTGDSLDLLVRSELDEWIFDAALRDDDVMYVAYGHGAIAQLDARTLCRLRVHHAMKREMSWSATMHHSDEGLLVAHGTSFGPVVLRRFDRDFSHVCDTHLAGHAGAVTKLVFSADGTLFASTSVDRSVRVWRNVDGEFQPVRVHFGHLARVWDVAFLGPHDPTVVSVGEDRYARTWAADEDSLQLAAHVVQDGRNVWAVDVLHNRYVVAGGDDGVIKLRSLTPERVTAPGKPLEFVLPHDYQNPKENWSSAPNESGSAIVFHGGYVYCSTDFGRVLRCPLPMTSDPQWEVLITDKRGTAFSPNALVIVRNVLIVGQTDGNVFVLTMEEDREVSVLSRFIGTGEEKRMVMGVWAFEDMDDASTLHVFVTNPAGDVHYWNVVATDGDDSCFKIDYVVNYRHETLKKNTLVTCVSFLQRFGYVLTGDRGGRIFVYSLKSDSAGAEAHPLFYCRPHKDRVTELIALPTSDDGVCDILSAAFDGRIVSLKFDTTERSLQVMSTQRSMERIDTIARMYLPGGDFERPVLLGFRSKYAVLWDVEQGNELMRCDCGNWRRPFDCSVDLAVEDGAVVVRKVMFAFWRAGRLFIDQREGDDARVQSIGPPFHGLRVNALCKVGADGDDVYLMTAGEDTLVRVMKCSRSSGEWTTVQTLTKHISGVYGVAAVTNSAGKLVAVSVGGCDEAVLWLAESVDGPWRCVDKVLGAGELQNGNGRRKRERNLNLANHRILCVDWLPHRDCGTGLHGVMGVIGRSDGSVALLRCVEVDNDWNMMISGHATENQGAVMCVALCERGEKVLIASGDSAGYVCIWELDIDVKCAEPKLHLLHRALVHPGGVLSLDVGAVFVSGGDDGCVCVFKLNGEKLNITRRTVSAGGVSGVVVNGNRILAVAMCQGLWSWRLSENVHNLQLVDDVVADICDPSDIVCAAGDVFVSGYGLQRVEGLG